MYLNYVHRLLFEHSQQKIGKEPINTRKHKNNIDLFEKRSFCANSCMLNGTHVSRPVPNNFIELGI